MSVTLLKFITILLFLMPYGGYAIEIAVASQSSSSQSSDSKENRSKQNYGLTSQLSYQAIAPTLDGILAEPQWQQATVIELKYQNEPIYNALAPVKTLAYIYQDDSSLHIAIQAFDPRPKEIRANLREHDNIVKDDNVGIIIDTYNDKRSAFGFFVNPLGAQADFTQKETDDSGDAEDYAWNAIWHSAGKVNAQGYIVEMSIPFHALRFPATGKALTWNIAIKRNYPRDSLIEIANYQQDHNRKCIICQYEPLLGFKQLKKSQNLQLTPTLTLGRTDIKNIADEQHGEQNTQRWQTGDVEPDIGLDLRWGINQNLLLNATINPDFSQVEADATQLAINTNYALYYDEKRPFFVDGADYFTTPLFNFVHTRNIADPNYGLKLTGKTNEHLYGVMVADDNQTTILIPGNQSSDLAQLDIKSTATIARYRLDMGKLNNIGALMTLREADGYHNNLLSIDGAYWFNNNTSVNYQVAHSDTKNPDEIQQDFNLEKTQSGQAYQLSFAHRSKDFGLFAELARVDADFRADLGFEDDVNVQSVSLSSFKEWFVSEQLWLASIYMNKFSIDADWDKKWDLNQQLLEQELELTATFEGDKQSWLEVGAVHRNRLYNNNYYRETQMTFWLELTPVADITPAIFMRYGDQIDFTNEQLGTRFKIAGWLTWQMNQHLQLEAEYNYSNLTVDEGELYNANILDAKFIWQFNSRHQLRFIMQYSQVKQDASLYNNSADIVAKSQDLATQLLYSYTINPQTLFYLGYADNGYSEDGYENEGYNNSNQQFIRTDRSVFAKFSYAYEIH